MHSRIYFDHSATTPLDPRVLEAMGLYLGARMAIRRACTRKGESRDAPSTKHALRSQP